MNQANQEINKLMSFTPSTLALAGGYLWFVVSCSVNPWPTNIYFNLRYQRLTPTTYYYSLSVCIFVHYICLFVSMYIYLSSSIRYLYVLTS